MIVRQIHVGPMANMVYLIMDEESREAIAVDSGWDIGPIVDEAVSNRMEVRHVVATHRHFDHVKTIPELARRLGASVAAHESSAVRSDLRLKDGDEIALGGTAVRVLHTPGHTEDSICLFDGKNLFTGDTLFMGNCGRTDLPGGSPELLFQSLRRLASSLPPETVVFPGHDYGSTPFGTLGQEMKTNPTLLARSVEEFLGVE